MPRLQELGIPGVLFALVLFFSWATFAEQPTTGRTGAIVLADQLIAQFPLGTPTIIVLGGGPDDQAFGNTLHERLTAAHFQIVADVQGTPAEARQQLRVLHDAGQPVALLAGTSNTASWTFLHDANSFPKWADTVFVQPPSYSWPSFLLADNLRNIVSQIAVIAIVAIGMTFVITTGGIDLSVGSLMALAAMVAALLLRDHFGGRDATLAGQGAACLAALAACATLGLATGLLVTRFGLPPFIATLGVMWIARGIAFKLSGGESISDIPASFTRLGRGADLASIPNVVTLMLALYLIAYFLLHRTILGRHITAVGSNARAAFLSGVPVRRVLLFVYTASATLAGLGGLLLASQLQTGDPKFGQEYELFVITAVVVGGTSLRGGDGRIVGTLLGALLISVVQVGMNLLHVDRFSQWIILGNILLASVLIDRLQKRPTSHPSSDPDPARSH